MSARMMLAQLTAVGIPVGNEVTNNGIITALDFESMVLFGYTYGAIFKILALFSVVLIILINLYKLTVATTGLVRKIRKNNPRKKKSPLKVTSRRKLRLSIKHKHED